MVIVHMRSVDLWHSNEKHDGTSQMMIFTQDKLWISFKDGDIMGIAQRVFKLIDPWVLLG